MGLMGRMGLMGPMGSMGRMGPMGSMGRMELTGRTGLTGLMSLMGRTDYARIVFAAAGMLSNATMQQNATKNMRFLLDRTENRCMI